MLNLNQDAFIAQYVTTFLATWAVKEYDSACARGEQKRLNKPPVEDAVYLARMAWMHLLELAINPLVRRQ
jgi:hypothetical protein